MTAASTDSERLAGQASVEPSEGYGCPECQLYSCICFEDDEYDPEEDDGWDECGMMPDGFCSLAGTEWCDWDCPRNRPVRAHQETRP